MKTRRLKDYKRLLTIYSEEFGLPLDPLEVFVDSTFARQALINKLSIKDQFELSLKVPIKLVTSDCVLSECGALGKLFSGALSVLKQYEVLPCHHAFDFSKGAPWCVRKRIRLAKKNGSLRLKKSILFGLASNDEALQAACRLVPGMPVFFIAHNRINMEPMPTFVSEHISAKAVQACDISSHELSAIRGLEARFGTVKHSVTHRKKHSKLPNPLSCKKKAPKSEKMQVLKDEVRKRRRRKRIKMTWAMRQVLEKLKAEYVL
ncbi:unnamed protein product [Calicophoron daubneyi]|uniref:Uncharacterized protein n=1 Tax=Calicophoron daubneyi TaxID=300641 RepID=A0AAV2TQU6_CALDB